MLAFMIALVGGISWVLVWLLHPSFIYLSTSPSDSRREVRTPDQVGFGRYETVPLKTTDGLTVYAYWLPYQSVARRSRRQQTSDSDASDDDRRNHKDHGNRDHRNRRPTILYLHGNAGNVGHRLPLLAKLMTAAGANILALSYRGYGRSEGTFPSQAGLLMDAQAALRHILEERAAVTDSLILMGHSLGVAVAFALATSAKGNTVTGIIGEAAWTSVPEVVRDGFKWPLSMARFAITERWDSIGRVHELVDTAVATNRMPSVLLLVGGMDRVIPQEHSKRLADELRRGGKNSQTSIVEVATFSSAGHLEISEDKGYLDKIVHFIENCRKSR